MPRRVTRAEAVDEVARVADRFPERTVFVGIDGFGGAGKSVLASAVATRVPRATVVRVDDFWGPGIRQWDWDRFRAQVLLPLLAGRAARYQLWNWAADAGRHWVDVPPGVVLVVEGVSCTRTEAGVPWDLTIWVDASRDVRLARALQRDGPGMTSRWLDDWIPSEEAYAGREQPQARVDLVVSGVE